MGHIKGIRIVCISDTHNATPPVEDGDILLHAGDLTNTGSLKELQAQLNWLASLPHAHKVVVAGNHDMLLDAGYVAPRGIRFEPGGTAADLDWHDIHYLCSESVVLELPQGSVRIYGSPLTPAPRGLKGAFQYDPEEDVWAGRVPETDVLLVHGPPRGYLDQGKGCPHLRREVERVKPQAVVFGHIHGARGTKALVLSQDTAGPEGPAERREPQASRTGGFRRRLSRIFGSRASMSPPPEPSRNVPEQEQALTTMVNAAVHWVPDLYEAASLETKEGYVVNL